MPPFFQEMDPCATWPARSVVAHDQVGSKTWSAVVSVTSAQSLPPRYAFSGIVRNQAYVFTAIAPASSAFASHEAIHSSGRTCWT